MTTEKASTNYQLFDQIAEQFTAAIRAGESPHIEGYAESFPALAEKIRAIFPAIVMMEDLLPVRPDDDGNSASW